MKSGFQYPIGTQGQPWGDKEKKAWLETTSVKRDYNSDVVTKINALRERFDVFQYGALSYDTDRFPLFAIKSKTWDTNRKTILVTGGVHGYETSGVHGALKFVDLLGHEYEKHFNLIVAPCISPWGYETINRWNPNAVDPNRSFYENSPAEESANLMAMVKSLGTGIYAHIDLHETTDTDESEFRPALAARDGLEYIEDLVPDGFYLVGDTENPNEAFQTAIIKAVEKVTHIAPPDSDGNIIGSPVVQHGVINYPTNKLGLCSGFTGCEYGTTTEVYPDSPKVTDEECNDAQVASIKGGLDYLLSL
ncbi:putative Peptidase_M14-like_4 family protein [Vibrio nigripulchritudo SFn27]|uniref:Putative Peptidase_M14-like_4 family protein n=1 Tax=Vibrio nigripulchritudo TaxID=28173 RepID=U4K755_9VIBR|nr:M14 family metallocarboxypeptidase [Vibrio nigripulchritudo]CCN90025.1 putative Peptidase_M14-like_4 family protein [Vibrio nigripulchritudo SFn27]CCN93369.1 putative Peptidase_M14-like_4 family protein [Vibrio nigripulchritudo ENn2]CCO42201.1 putative Peptidase_M14-like_4 family protein [Vibrio nigripulchritudo SFn135]CCO61162.1 putative Peptidase_M14-like_4 family protein [Vibrio nigripulchritudo]